MQEEALQLASIYRFHVFPVSSPAQISNADGKRPLINDWPGKATTDPVIIKNWWSTWPQANIGIATGETSGVWVLDVDVKGDDGYAALEELKAEVGGLPDTLMARSGSGGLHLCFRYEPGTNIRNRAGIKPGIDVRGDGGFIVAPPSLHANGSRYEWIH